MRKIFFLISILIFKNIVHAQNNIHLSNPAIFTYDTGLELDFINVKDASYYLFDIYTDAKDNGNTTLEAQFYKGFNLLKANNPKGEVLVKKLIKENPNHPKSVFANFNLGLYYFTNKQYKDAIPYLANVNLAMLDESDKLDNNFRLGYSYMVLKEFEKAGNLFQRLKSTKNKYTFAANYYLGYINLKKELYDIAKSNLKKANENEAYKVLIPQIMVNVFQKQKQYDSLIIYANHVLSTIPNLRNKEEILQHLADAYFNIKSYKEALPIYKELSETKSFAFSDANYLKWGYALYQNNQNQESISILKKIAERNDSIGQNAAYYLALNYLKQDEKQFAYNALKQTKNQGFNPSITEEALYLYCSIAFDLNYYTEVIEGVKEYFRKFPNGRYNEQLNSLFIETLFYTNDLENAYSQIEKLKVKTLSINKAYQQICYFLGLDRFQKEQYTEAADFFEKSIQFDYDIDIYAHANLWGAETYSILKKYQPAYKLYTNVLKINNLSTELKNKANYGIGYALYNNKEYEKAINYFKNYISEPGNNSNATNCDAYLRLGDCYLAVKKHNDAQLSYSKAIENKCNNIDYAYLQKGIALSYLNKNELAKEQFLKVTSIYPKSKYYTDALYNIGLIEFENTKYASSIVYFTKIIEGDKSSNFVPLALLKRAVAYNNLKKYENSAQDYKEIITSYPTSKIAANALTGLQDALTHLDKSEELDSILETFKLFNPKNAEVERLEYEKIKDLYFNQNFASVITKAEKFLSEYTQSELGYDVKYFLAESYLKTKQTDAAKETFAEVIDEQKSGYTNRAILKLADVCLEEKEYDFAIKYYNLLLKKASNTKEEYNAYQGLMLSYFESDKPDSSAKYGIKIINGNPPSIVMYNRALNIVSKATKLIDESRYIDQLIKCFNEAEDQNGAECAYLLALHLNQNKQFKQSLEILFDLNNKFPSYSQWIGPAFLLIADNYYQLGENYQAKATLLSIIERAKDQDLINTAKEKLSEFDTPQE